MSEITKRAAADAVLAGFNAWAAKPHNAKWVKRIDGTPIPNDLPVCIQTAIMELPAAPAVKVKPLEWRQYGDAGSVAFSDVTGRQYAIFPSVGREGEFAMRGSEDRGFTYHLSIEAAQTAAQEHHAARILAALEGCV